ncbi:purine/pyrimidine permease [Bacillus licheniformis]|nr:purine/pyrimidine permease [Bacillus licheniformis]
MFTPVVTGIYLLLLVIQLSDPIVKGVMGIGYRKTRSIYPCFAGGCDYAGYVSDEPVKRSDSQAIFNLIALSAAGSYLPYSAWRRRPSVRTSCSTFRIFSFRHADV